MPFYAQLTIPFFMAVSGFVYAASQARRASWYEARNVRGKLARVVLPYLPALLVELVVLGLPGNWAVWLASGGYELPGSYYVILMIELLALFPVVTWLVRVLMAGRWQQRFGWLPGLLVVLVLHCLYELATWAVGLPQAAYRLLVFRYLVFLYGGALVYGYRVRGCVPWREFAVLASLGLAWSVLVVYVGYQPQVLFRYDTWFRSAAPTALWVLPCFACLVAHECSVRAWLQKVAGRVAGKLADALALVGQASWHVFVVQMLWFGLVMTHLPTGGALALAWFPVSVVVCAGLGIGYFRLEVMLRGKASVKRA